MITDRSKLWDLCGNLGSMVFPDFQKIVSNILKDGKLSKKELAVLFNTDVSEINEILEGNFSNVTLLTYLFALVANSLTLDVHSVEAPYGHSSDKVSYDNIEKDLNVQFNQKLSKEELADLLGISVVDVEKFLYDHSDDKSKYDKVEKKLNEKTNEFLNALKECKPDSTYLQQLRELAKTNAGNEKLCNLIKYYTD